jgi:putative Flp pilus-assembly TadE/G-like protein
MKQRQQGQIVAIFALSLVAILAMAGVVIDGGNIYVQRRTAQNAADAAALAGTRALLAAQNASDSTIAGEICKYANSNAFGVIPTPTAFFVGLDGSPGQTITLPAGCPSGQTANNVIPNGQVAGVHVDVNIPFHTYIAGMIGIANVTAAASATAQVGAMTGINADDAPVAGCGVMMDTGGQSAPDIFKQPLPTNGDLPVIDYNTWVNTTFILQSSQLWKHSQHPPCPIYNSGNGDWKGTIDGSGTITINSQIGTYVPTVNGNSAADLTTPCLNAHMGDPANGGLCYLAIPITDGNNPQSGQGLAHVVAFACMKVFAGGNGNDLWDGTLVDAGHCGPSGINSYSYNWTWAPGSETIARIALTH